MFIEERHQAILDWISSNGRISIGDIQGKFDVSADSARRDLRLLEEHGLLKRTHGGAIPVRQVGSGKPAGCCPKDITEVRENYFAIAMEALNHIRENDVIYLTPATVGFFMAQHLPAFPITVVTNSIIIAEEIRKKPNVRTILVGGDMSSGGVCKSATAVEMIRRIRFDTAFVTAAGISADFGLSIQSAENVELINTVIRQAKRSIGLFPTEKIGLDSILSICPAGALSLMITDWDASEEELRKLDKLGVEILVAEKREGTGEKGL